MKWGMLTMRCQHCIDEIEKEVHVTLRHLATPIEEVGQFKLDA